MINPSIVERVINLAAEFQQIPSPTFQEARRAEYLLHCFIEQGIKDAFIDETGNVYGGIKGLGISPPLIISAHLDTVFPPETDLSLTRTHNKLAGAGIGDNCLGLAGLFGLYWALIDTFDGTDQVFLPGDLWLVANVGEEGLGDLKGMKAVVDHFRHDVLAYLILEGMSLGQIYHRGLGVRRYRISVHTKGGHSWVDYGAPSAIHELGELIVRLKNLPIPDEPRTSLNVGMISGGTSVNTIAAEASLQLDLRSVNSQVLKNLVRQVEGLVSQVNQRGGGALQVRAEIIGDRPAGAIPADHFLVKTALDCYQAQGIKVKLNIGSTDTNIPLSLGMPAICVGLTTGGGAHSRGEYIDIQPVQAGLEALTNLVQSIFEKQSQPNH